MDSVSRMRRVLTRILLVVASPLLVIASAEFVLRMMYPYKINRGYARSDSFVFSPQYLLGMKPGVSGTYVRRTRNGAFVTKWNTNADGFRGAELRSNPELRAIVYGDSNIFARFSNLEDTFPYRLEQELHSRIQKDVEVLNAGVVSFGPDQSLVRFENEVDKYRPDIVVFHVFADNDFGDIVRDRLFDVRQDGSLSETPFPRTIDHCLGLRYSPCPPTESFIDVLTDRAESLVLSEGIRRTLIKVGVSQPPAMKPPAEAQVRDCLQTAEQEYDIYTRSEPRKFSVTADHYDCDLALYPERESSVVKRRLMSAVLARAARVASEKRVKFMVLIEPSSRDLTTNLRPNYTDFEKFSGYRQTNLSSAVEEILQERHISELNLFATFSRHHPETLYFTDNDDHWNPAGQALAASETARYLASEGLLQ